MQAFSEFIFRSFRASPASFCVNSSFSLLLGNWPQGGERVQWGEGGRSAGRSG